MKAAFRGMSSMESFESFESIESASGAASPADGEDAEDGEDSRLDCRSLRSRLAALERTLASGGEQEREQSRIVHWERRRLRSLAQRKADLEATLLNVPAEGQDPAEFDDFTVHLYRKTAADFASRRSQLEDMVFRPVRTVACGVLWCCGVVVSCGKCVD